MTLANRSDKIAVMTRTDRRSIKRFILKLKNETCRGVKQMTEGISKEAVERIIRDCNIDHEHKEIAGTLREECRELDPWLPIESSTVDNKEYLFITKNKSQRVDRFHSSQRTTVNTDLRWQERPGDRYTHYKLLPEDPKEE